MGKYQKGVVLLPIILILVSLVILGVILYSNATTTTESKIDTIKPNDIETSQQSPLGNPSIEVVDDKILFTDSINNYYLDLTSLPEVSITEADVWDIYEFEMYKRQGEFNSSVARFGISEPMDNPNNLSLEEYAKQNYRYKQGTDNASRGWGELITSPVEFTLVGNEYEAINWTEENQTDSGFYFDNYLFNLDGKVVYVRMVVWQKDIFENNRPILKEILDTFDLASNLD